MRVETALDLMLAGDWLRAHEAWSAIEGPLKPPEYQAFAKTLEVLQAWHAHRFLLERWLREHPDDASLQLRWTFHHAVQDLHAERWTHALDGFAGIGEPAEPGPWAPAIRFYRREADIGRMLEGMSDLRLTLEHLAQRQAFKYTRPYPPEQLAGIERAVAASDWHPEVRQSFLAALQPLLRWLRGDDREIIVIQEPAFAGIIELLAVFLRYELPRLAELPAPYEMFFCRILLMYGHLDLYQVFRKRFIDSLRREQRITPEPRRLVDFAYQVALANECEDYSAFQALKRQQPIFGQELPFLQFSQLYYRQGESVRAQRPTSTAEHAFAKLIQGRSIALVGPVDVGLQGGEEIDSFDFVVRFNHHAGLHYAAPRFGARTDISYYVKASKEPHIIEAMNQLQFVLCEEDCALLKGVTTPARQRPQAWSYLVSPFLIDMANSVQQALMDLLQFYPSRVKVFNINLFLNLDYVEGYAPVRSEEFFRILSVHDPASNFIFTQRLYQHRRIEADSVLSTILNMSVDQYLAALAAGSSDARNVPTSENVLTKAYNEK